MAVDLVNRNIIVSDKDRKAPKLTKLSRDFFFDEILISGINGQLGQALLKKEEMILKCLV